jgi:hypothetical protein
VPPQDGVVVKIGTCRSATSFAIELDVNAIKWPGGGAQPPERNPYIVLSGAPLSLWRSERNESVRAAKQERADQAFCICTHTNLILLGRQSAFL